VVKHFILVLKNHGVREECVSVVECSPSICEALGTGKKIIELLSNLLVQIGGNKKD
jgi:hypothetical protein